SDCRDVISRIYFINLQKFDENGKEINTQLPPTAKLMCQFPWSNLMVNPYGDATVCCTMNGSALFDPVNIGKVSENLSEFWCKGELITQLREETLKHRFKMFDKVCQSCSEKWINARVEDSSPHSDFS
uniref:SPASM domain-containing protein n=1 Tax=Helicobacter mesocricetorum TaxID=87012 RepID=UPI001F30A135